MQTGVFANAHLGKLVPCVLQLLLLTHLCPAPGVPGAQREESVDVHSPPVALPNPFGSGEENRRLLQSYIQANLKEGQGGTEISSWEQEVFFLFRLYDFDRSELLDGLEMMKLLSDYRSHHTPGAQGNEMVVSTVDFLLQTQDQNQDGLLAPSELLSHPLPLTQDDAPHGEQEVAAEEMLLNPGAGEERAGAAEQREEPHVEVQPPAEQQPHHEVTTEEEEQLDQNNAQKLQEVPEANQAHYRGAPVHQGQPEM